MIHRINDTIEMKDLPTWLQELWEQNPSLARRAEKHYLELKEQCNMPNVVGQSEQYFCENEEVGYNKRCNKQCSDCNWIESL